MKNHEQHTTNNNQQTSSSNNNNKSQPQPQPQQTTTTTNRISPCKGHCGCGYESHEHLCQKKQVAKLLLQRGLWFLKFNSSHLPEGFRAYNPLFEGSARNSLGPNWLGLVQFWGTKNEGIKICRYLDPPFVYQISAPQNYMFLVVKGDKFHILGRFRYIYVCCNLHSFKFLGCFLNSLGDSLRSLDIWFAGPWFEIHFRYHVCSMFKGMDVASIREYHVGFEPILSWQFCW